VTPSEIIQTIENRSKAKRFDRDEREFYAALAALLKYQSEQIRALQEAVAKLQEDKA
jgi:hypothetical protein